MTGFTARNRVSLKEAFEGLELCERKLSRLLAPTAWSRQAHRVRWKFWEKAQLPSLLRQPHFPHQFGEAWVGAYRIEYEVSFHTVH
jgi:hypothetical protein